MLAPPPVQFVVQYRYRMIRMEDLRPHGVSRTVTGEFFLALRKIKVIGKKVGIRELRCIPYIGTVLVKYGKTVIGKQALKSPFPDKDTLGTFAELVSAGRVDDLFYQCPGTPFIGGEGADGCPGELYGLGPFWFSQEDEITVHITAEIVREEEGGVHAPAEDVHAPAAR